MHKLIEEQVKKTSKATNSTIIMEANKELIGELLIDLKGTPIRKYDLEELVLVLEKCKYMSFPSIKNDITAFKYIRRFGIMDALLHSEAVPIGPMFKRTSSQIRARIPTRCLFSRCPRWGPDPGYTWSIECNPEEI